MPEKILPTVSPVILADVRCLSLLLLTGFDAPRVNILLCFLSLATWSLRCSKALRVSLLIGILLPPRIGVSEIEINFLNKFGRII